MILDQAMTSYHDMKSTNNKNKGKLDFIKNQQVQFCKKDSQEGEEYLEIMYLLRYTKYIKNS